MVKTKIALIAAAGILLASQASWAATSAAVGALHCKSSLVHFTTVQDAVDHVELSGPGGTVFVCPGTYQEQVTINQSLTLTGVADGPQDAPVITAPAGALTTVPDLRVALLSESRSPLAAQILVSNTQAPITVNISNLIVDGGTNTIPDCNTDLIGILYQNANGTINHVVTRNQIIQPYSTNGGCQSGMGVLVQNDNTQTSNPTSALTVSGSTVHSFQKNGIAAQLPGATLKATGNTVLGLGPTTGAGQNGIEVAYGAGGTVSGNSVSDFDFTPNTDTAAGILNYDSGFVTISNNTIANAQEGIAVAEVNPNDTDGTSITGNRIYGSHSFDGIDVCGDGTTVKSNIVNSSDEAGIHNDSTCTGGNTGNVISGNTINEACAGLLTGTAPTNAPGLSPNTFFNVGTTVKSGDTCGTPVFTSFARTSGGTSMRVQP